MEKASNPLDPKHNRSFAHNKALKEGFTYHHNNPYHDYLNEFENFVLRDGDTEKHPGNWNSEIFKKEAPLHVEIGTGFGYFMREFCQKNTDIHFVGLDFRFKRSFTLAKNLKKEFANFDNLPLRYLRARGERLSFMFGENEIDALHYYFPDPWPKARHHKKRLFQLPFLESIKNTIKKEGKFYIKTDHDDYFKWMLTVVENQDWFRPEAISWDVINEMPDHLLGQYQTKFEKIFMAQGTPTKGMVLVPNE